MTTFTLIAISQYWLRHPMLLATLSDYFYLYIAQVVMSTIELGEFWESGEQIGRENSGHTV